LRPRQKQLLFQGLNVFSRLHKNHCSAKSYSLFQTCAVAGSTTERKGATATNVFRLTTTTPIATNQ
jgi:hypothetical protein